MRFYPIDRLDQYTPRVGVVRSRIPLWGLRALIEHVKAGVLAGTASSLPANATHHRTGQSTLTTRPSNFRRGVWRAG